MGLLPPMIDFTIARGFVRLETRFVYDGRGGMRGEGRRLDYDDDHRLVCVGDWTPTGVRIVSPGGSDDE